MKINWKLWSISWGIWIRNFLCPTSPNLKAIWNWRGSWRRLWRIRRKLGLSWRGWKPYVKVSLPSFRIWRNRNNHLRINLKRNNPNFWPWRKPNNPCSLKWRRRKLSGKWRNKLLWINMKSKNKFCRGSSERIRS